MQGYRLLMEGSDCSFFFFFLSSFRDNLMRSVKLPDV